MCTHCPRLFKYYLHPEGFLVVLSTNLSFFMLPILVQARGKRAQVGPSDQSHAADSASILARAYQQEP